MDNPQFNVNGRIESPEDRESLLSLLKIRCLQHGFGQKCISGYSLHKDRGIVLYVEHVDIEGYVRFPSTMTPESVMPIINSFLDDNNLTNTTTDNDVNPCDPDVSVRRGWRIFCEEWGHVGESWQAIVAIKKVWLWYGK